MFRRHPLSDEDRRIWLLIIGIVVLFMAFVPFSQAVFDVNFDYTLRTVALGGSALGVVSGVLGSFAVLRQQSLMGDALSHAALPGVGVAFLLAGRDLEILLLGAGVSSWIGVMFISAVTRTTRIKQDAAMGIVLAAWFAFGIALLTYIQSRPDASQAGLDSFIFGQAAAIVERDVRLIIGVGAVSFVVLALFWKHFKLITFDPEFAGANGVPVGFFDTLLSTLIVVAIVLGLQLAGVILMVGMLIAPGVAARQWTHKLEQMVVLAAVFGAFAGGTGSIISAMDTDVPTGPMMIVMAFLVVFLSILFAPGRGLTWSWLRARQDRRKFAVQNVLRDMYRYAMSHDGEATAPVPAAMVTGVRGAGSRAGVRELLAGGLVREHTGAWCLTASGAEAAAEDAHNLRLWDAYRFYADQLHLPLVREDRQRSIREVLSAEDVARLEAAVDGQPKGVQV